jgi:hypothetical protein
MAGSTQGWQSLALHTDLQVDHRLARAKILRRAGRQKAPETQRNLADRATTSAQDSRPRAQARANEIIDADDLETRDDRDLCRISQPTDNSDAGVCHLRVEAHRSLRRSPRS